MPSLSEIQDSIEGRIMEVHNEIARLEAARRALREDGTQPRAAPLPRGKRHAPTTRRSSVKVDNQMQTSLASNGRRRDARSPGKATNAKPATVPDKPRTSTVPRRRVASRTRPAAFTAATLETLLADADEGLTVAEIAARSNAPVNQVRNLLRELESAGQVRRTRGGRAARWQLVTDEHRTAERAAELAELRKANA
jgi:hypothetical protein